MSFMQKGQKCMFSKKEFLFYTRIKAEALETENPCCIKLRPVVRSSNKNKRLTRILYQEGTFETLK
jgi:hypothetical protein